VRGSVNSVKKSFANTVIRIKKSTSILESWVYPLKLFQQRFHIFWLLSYLRLRKRFVLCTKGKGFQEKE